MYFHRPAILLFYIVLASCHITQTYAEVSKIEIISTELVLDGKEWGNSGSYELLKGKIFFAFNPRNQYNSRITDLILAKTNSSTMAEAWTDIVILKPTNASASSGVGLVEVSNRGGKISMSSFCRAKNNDLDPNDPESFGDGLLLEQGLTMVWLGWQFDVPEGKGLKLRVPIAQNPDGSTILGQVRSDWTVDEDVSSLNLGHGGMEAYPVAEPNHDANILTVRKGRDEVGRFIPRDQWDFGKVEDGITKSSNTDIYLKGGFKAGNIYELVYVAKDPPIVGLGLAVIRDVISYMKFSPQCTFGVKHGIAVGVSQTGRFLRQFIYQGFNSDESNRKCYDGMMIMVAGAGRGSFNHRFAQPSRDAHRYSAFFYPTDIFPFSSRTQMDEANNFVDGLGAHQWGVGLYPKVFYINSGYEYWGRAASLIHTTPDSKEDIEPLGSERIFHIASAQHFVEGLPDKSLTSEKSIYKSNPIHYLTNYRALMLAMIDWVSSDSEPPLSAYPMISSSTLVDVQELKFEPIGELKKPQVIHTAYRADYGQGWPVGIISYQPPRLNEQYVPKVSQVDSLGNEMAGIRNLELQVPLATYTPWFVRQGMAGGNGELLNFRGTFCPLPVEESTNDHRPAIKSLYKNKKDYLNKVDEALDQLIELRYVLPRDKEFLQLHARNLWDWAME